jgi:predicted  nucleic acid-binding Zn-ribbon protein
VNRFICTKCGKVWYTADMRSGQKCDDCKGDLVDTELYEQERPDNKTRLNNVNVSRITRIEES